MRQLLLLVWLLLAAGAARAQTPEEPPPPPAQRSTVYLTRDETGQTNAEITLYLATTDRYCSMSGSGSDANAAVALSKAIIQIEQWHRTARAEIDAIRQQVLFEEVTP
jgi:hypothetical protein